ncbi:hypothetical protein JTB14_037403 [Gonioctena quinquepunctata]|nr:hypothetical protein JTB14_037403 [Gonioctena quinquepunctata]
MERKSGGLFTSMINTFMKLKQEASDFPSHITDPAEREKYIEDYLEREGIKLEYSNITINPGLRQLAKLILNSFWGKFGQRENQTKTKILNSPEELFDLLTDPAIIVNASTPVNGETLVCNYERRDEVLKRSDQIPRDAIKYIVLKTTEEAQNRDKVGFSFSCKSFKNARYPCDTDSVIYISRDGEWDVPTVTSQLSLWKHHQDESHEYEKNSQSPYKQYLERIEHFYDNEMRAETRPVNEVGYDSSNFPLYISTGYSAARNFLPVVKLTLLPANNYNNNRSISLMDLDWYEFTFNSGLQPVEGVPAHMESTNFKLISFPSVMKRRILKLESYGVEIYLEDDWLVELSKCIPLITSRLEILKRAILLTITTICYCALLLNHIMIVSLML